MNKFFTVFKKNYETPRLKINILEPNVENAKLVYDVLKRQNKQDFQYAPMTDKILPETLDETLMMMQNQDEWCKTNGVNWYVFYNDELIGDQRMFYWENNKTLQCADVWIAREYWGNGFNQEIHKLIEQLAFTELKANRICRQCMKDNKKSFDSITKSGFHLDGINRQFFAMPDGTYMDQCLFSKLKSEYNK
ncbi:MAG: GNAT family N-acetyltransferase [Alphaproteobacteria bacterium]|nr:GNAT family N-acetyltransferase [Alphaproteobacteria bacterium]